ncbi:hypothetical protein PGQ11_009280 [Apiospora arundinis]|uniref:Uncharacterized protein n=1 Tax=Apiospora arundinis TaxID=335852 RepID=A0ABR2IIM1_9PEZI
MDPKSARGVAKACDATLDGLPFLIIRATISTCGRISGIQFRSRFRPLEEISPQRSDLVVQVWQIIFGM